VVGGWARGGVKICDSRDGSIGQLDVIKNLLRRFEIVLPVSKNWLND